MVSAAFAAAAVLVTAAPFRVDLHAHVTMARAARPLFQGEAGKGPLARHGTQLHVNQLDAEALREAGVWVVVVALWPPFDLRPARGELDEALGQLRALDAFVLDHPDFGLARSADEIERMVSLGRIALFPMVEGGEGIRTVEDVDALYAAGARGLTLVHFHDNPLGGAMRIPNLRAIGVPPDRASYRGLSHLGEAVIRRMIALGMVLDLCHASEGTAASALALTEAARAPVLLSHLTSWELTPFEPNVPDALAQRVARGGGMIGISVQRNWTRSLPEEAKLPGHVSGTCDDVVAQWRHYFRLVPPEAVALGSDFNGFIVRPDRGGRCPDGIASTRELVHFFSALREVAPDDASLDRSAARFVELLRKVEAQADPAAQAAARAVTRREASAFESPL